MAFCLSCFSPPDGMCHGDQTEWACQCPHQEGYGCGIGCQPCDLQVIGAPLSIGTSEHGERWIRPRQQYGTSYRDGEGIIRNLLSRSTNSFLAPRTWAGEGGVCFDQCTKTECFNQQICNCKWALKGPEPGVTCTEFKLVCGTFKECGHYQGVGYPKGAQVKIICRECTDTKPMPVWPYAGTTEGDILLQYGEARFCGCTSNQLMFCLGFMQFDPGCETRPQDQYWIEDWQEQGQHLWDYLDMDYGNIHFMKHNKFHHTPEELHNIDAKNKALDLLRKKRDGMGRLHNHLGQGGRRAGVNNKLDYWWNDVDYVNLRGCGNLPIIYSYPKSYLKYLGCKIKVDLVVRKITVECSLVIQKITQGVGMRDRKNDLRPAIALKIHIHTALHVTEIEKSCPKLEDIISYDNDCNLRMIRGGIIDEDIILVTEDGTEVRIPPYKIEWWGTRNAFSIEEWKNIFSKYLSERCGYESNGWQNCVIAAASINGAEVGGYQIYGMPSRYDKNKLGREVDKQGVAMIYGGVCGIRITNGKEAHKSYCTGKGYSEKGSLPKRYKP